MIPTTYSKIRYSAATLFVLLLVAVCASPTKANPLVFSNLTALQNSGTTQIDLFSNPGATLTGPQLSFKVDLAGTLAPGGTDTLRITYHEDGSAPVTQTFQIPVFGTVQPPITLFFTVNSICTTCKPLEATLALDLLSSIPDFVIPSGHGAGEWTDSYTYTFVTAQPVPEPATLIGLGSGLIALAARRRRKA